MAKLTHVALIALGALAIPSAVWGVNFDQLLAPGELSSTHAPLRGVSHCSDCHKVGGDIVAAKCLSCHPFIQQRQRDHAGFHGSREALGKNSRECHQEHKGGGKRLIGSRGPVTDLNHDLTGFELLGRHGRLHCRDCHEAGRIQDSRLKKSMRSTPGIGTFLGLSVDGGEGVGQESRFGLPLAAIG